MGADDDKTSLTRSSSFRVAVRADATGKLEALLASYEGATDPRARAEHLMAMAAVLRDDMRNPAQAFDALVEAWRADPTQPELLDELEPLARAHGRWLELFEATRQLVNAETVTARALAYAEAMAAWLSREVPHPDLAQQYLERVRTLDATSWLVHLFQAAIYQEHGDARRELEALDRAVLSARRAADRARIHVMMAQRYTTQRASNPSEAKKHFRKAHELAPKSAEALQGLEQVHLAEGDVAGLVAVLEKRVEATDVASERAALLIRLAEIYEREFLKPVLAAEKLEQAFVLDPNNDDALVGLERCYAATHSWDDLARVLEGALVLIEDPEVRAERLLTLAEVYESRLGDVAGAARSFEQLGAIIGDDETLIGELARLAEKMGDHAAAVRHRVKLAQLSSDPMTSARMHVVAGRLLEPHDAIASRAHFEMAITYDATNAAAYDALLSDARAKGDLWRVAGYLETRVAATTGPWQKAQILAELGDVLHELGDTGGALSAWEDAARADPTHEGAAGALLEVYVASERWADAAPFCELVVHAAEREDDGERLYFARCQAFAVASNLQRRERALHLILGAFAIHPEAVFVRESLVAAAWSLRADSLVLQATEALGHIATSRAGLPRDALVQLAETLAFVGDPARAMAIFDDVLAVDSNDAAALTGLAGLRSARGESLAAWTLKRQLAEGTVDERARLSLLVETADGLAREAKRPDLAADVYEKARAISPRDHVLLHKLLAQYQALEQWANACDVLRAIVDSDDDDARRAKVVMTMAAIAEGKLGDPMKAVSLCDEALDLDPRRLEAFERLVRILTGTKDWQGLAFMYGRMVARARGRDDVRLEHALQMQRGLVFRDRLHDRDKALVAFRRAAQLRPDDDHAQSILRELLTVSGRPNDAIAITLARVHDDPLDPAPYPALFDLLVQLGQNDRAWCVASVMHHVGAAHPAAKDIYRATSPGDLQHMAGTLGPEGWRQLVHPDLEPTLTTIFEIMAPAAVAARISALGLRERLSHPGPAFRTPASVVQDVAHASHILGVATPRLFAARSPPTVAVAVTRPPSLLVHSDSLPAFPRNLLAFWLGKRLVELTPPLLARGLFRSITELKDLAMAATRMVDGRRLERADAALRSQLDRVSLERLSDAVSRVKAGDGKLDVRRWSELADLSTSRAGLVLTGDVESARRALMQESQSPGDLAPREQMRELALFFSSEQYARIRASLAASSSR